MLNPVFAPDGSAIAGIDGRKVGWVDLTTGVERSVVLDGGTINTTTLTVGGGADLQADNVTLLGLQRMLSDIADIGTARLMPLPKVSRRLNDVVLPTHRGGRKHHVVATGQQAMPEVGVFTAEGAKDFGIVDKVIEKRAAPVDAKTP